jgi:hypothetical protein
MQDVTRFIIRREVRALVLATITGLALVVAILGDLAVMARLGG